MYDLIIIGGGPAGLTAGLYSARARLKTLLIESLSIPSQAMVTTLIENYPGFPDGIGGPGIIERIKKQVISLDLETISGDVKSIKRSDKTWLVILENRKIESLSLIIATGARPKELNVPGEEKFRGKGVSYCATCDAVFFKNKNIVAVGGGDSAIEETLFLTKFVKGIKLIHRRDKLRATRILQERILSNKKVEVIWNSTLKEILGKDKIEGVIVKNVKTSEESHISCDGIFIFIGYIPNTDFTKSIVKLDSSGYIITDENMKTSQEGIYACGDCRHKTLRQIITACGDGATAAFSAQKYVEDSKGIAYDSRKII